MPTPKTSSHNRTRMATSRPRARATTTTAHFSCELCHAPGTTDCDIVTEQCFCHPAYAGDYCSRCFDRFDYVDASGRCQKCACNTDWSDGTCVFGPCTNSNLISRSAIIPDRDVLTCTHCRAGYTGLLCDKCAAGYSYEHRANGCVPHRKFNSLSWHSKGTTNYR
jgi:hypothetical protein